MPEGKNVVVFGATGAIGTYMIEHIGSEYPNWTVRAVSRSGGQGSSRLVKDVLPKHKNISILQGEVESLEDCQRLVTNDVDFVVCTVGFARYEAKYWAEHWPIVVDNLLAVTSDACPLIFCDNLYAYGPKSGITTSTETVPPTMKSKPGVRATLRQKFQKRMDEHPKSIAVVGGADFFGPYITDLSFLGDTVAGKLVSGEQPMALFTSSSVHDFCYGPDFGRALFTLMDQFDDKAAGHFWICPHAAHGMTMQELSDAIYAKVNPESDKKPPKMMVLPGWLLRFLGLFMPLMREMVEMTPFWTNEYTIEGGKDFTKTFGQEPTSLDESLQALVDFYKAQA